AAGGTPAQTGGKLPPVGASDPAGIFVPILHDEGLIGPEVSVACPGKDSGKKWPPGVSVQELEKCRAQPAKFQAMARDLAGCYAYSLGYVEPNPQGDGERLLGLHRDLDDRMPVMADRPPASIVGNSPNHGGSGQNVLYLDGSVK